MREARKKKIEDMRNRKIYIRSNITTKNIDSRTGKNLSNII